MPELILVFLVAAVWLWLGCGMLTFKRFVSARSACKGAASKKGSGDIEAGDSDLDLAESREQENFYCELRVVNQGEAAGTADAVVAAVDAVKELEVRAGGRIFRSLLGHKAAIEIIIADITDGDGQGAQPVLSCIDDFHSSRSRAFCFVRFLNEFAGDEQSLDSGVLIAGFSETDISLPARGSRRLKLFAKLYDGYSFDHLGEAVYELDYENSRQGYNEEKTCSECTGVDANFDKRDCVDVHTVGLALKVCGWQLNEEQLKLLKDWISGIKFSGRNHQVAQGAMGTDLQENEKLQKILAEFRDTAGGEGERTIKNLCEKLVVAAGLAERIGAVDFCLRLIAVSDPDDCSIYVMLADAQIAARQLGVNRQRFLAAVQKIIPVEYCVGPAEEIVLGIDNGMDIEQIRSRLNSEYKKWNARVTSGNREVRNRAEHMLKLITAKRDVYLSCGLSV